MPVMDGLTATRAIRKNPQWATLPVIAMTANAMRSDIDNCLASGMNDFVAKPINPDLMWEAILRWLPSTHGVVDSTVSKLGTVHAQETTGVQAPSPASSPIPLDAIAFPQSLPGIDIADGLRRVNGNVPFFRTILLKYMDGQRDALEQIQKALAASDPDAAQRLAHTLKGVSGNIGAKLLEDHAMALEKAIRDQAPAELVEKLLTDVAPLLEEVVEGIRAAFDKPMEITVSDGDTTHATKKLEQLRALLKNDDAECVALFEAHRSLFEQTLGSNFETLAQAIEDFDFDSALRALPTGAST